MKSFVLATLSCLLLVASAFKLPEHRIYDGILASPTDFPYQVGVFITENGVSGSKCGGALVTDKVVLTAAHCFQKAQRGIVSAGSNKFLQGILREFNNVITHDFQVQNGKNDIALIRLDEPFPIDGKTIAIIPIDTEALPQATRVTVSGFGNIADDVRTNDLYYTSNLSAAPAYICKVHYPNFYETMICVEGKGYESTCGGDSGGPLVRDWPNNPVHVGIVSYGSSSCQRGDPTVYTRTSSYSDWILENSK